jgi:16S rRNA (cytosine1402-N4)-methyltransferase
VELQTNTESKAVTGRVHAPVLLAESIQALCIKPSGTYVDCTFGRGGHSQAILQQLNASGRLIALDRDVDAIAAGQALLVDSRLTLVHSAFSRLQTVLEQHAPNGIDGLLMDLGVSSPQLDQAARGFSFKQDGPLDMRMDQTRGVSAKEWLMSASENDIAKVLKDYGEERAAVSIAKTIVTRRGSADGAALQTTRQLAALVAGVLGRRQGSQGQRSALGKDPATRTFQAIRIFINQELEELAIGLDQAVQALRPQGRLAVISFHSLEDRIVKQFLVKCAGKNVESTDASAGRRHSTFHAAQLSQIDPVSALTNPIVEVFRKVMPSEVEQASNPRSRSAILRVAQKLGALA